MSDVLFFFIACSTNSDKDRSHLVFRYNEDGNITSLDPACSRNLENVWATTQLCNGLVQLNDDLEMTHTLIIHFKM